jgi:TIR domain
MTDLGVNVPGHSDSPAFEAFLSHRYASAEVNLYFFSIFRRIGQVQFEVDEGPHPISMTRLARMVRGADAFIGIYPLPEQVGDRVTAQQLQSASQYFRLELELATRARKPMAVFYDERFRAHLDLPAGIYQQAYDAQEVLSRGRTPSERRHQLAFDAFATSVKSEMLYRAHVESMLLTAPTTVGLLLPGPQHGYSSKLVRGLAEELRSRGYQAQRLPWPPVLTAGLVSLLRQLDWVLIDVADTVEGTTALAFLQGHAIPMLRLYHAADGVPSRPKVEKALFGGFEVGYCEDLLSWRTGAGLLTELAVRLDQVDAPVRRISTPEEAETYFRRAQLRKEQVFVSYASQDGWAATEVANELRKRFQHVFDYRDGGESLPPGTSWMSKLYSRLHSSRIGIPMLSSSYVNKKTCMREAEHMMIRADQGAMRVFPLNVDGVEPPAFLETLQFRPLARSTDVARLVDDLVSRYDEGVTPAVE